MHWAKDGLTQRELREQAGLMESTTFSAPNAMEKLGCVTRRHLHANKKERSLSHAEGRMRKATPVSLAKVASRIVAHGAQ